MFVGLDDEDNLDGENKQQFLDNFDDFIDIHQMNMDDHEEEGKARVSDRVGGRIHDSDSKHRQDVRVDKIGDVLG